MKKIKLLVASLLVATAFVNAQTDISETFNYQAVARDVAGLTMNNQDISIQISVIDSGMAIYTETHAITTTKFGMFTLNIGNGTPSLGDFSTIDWSKGNYNVEVAMDEKGGSDYTVMGESTLKAVPYAMHAKTAENVFSGDYNDLKNKPKEGNKAAGDAWLWGGNAGTTNGVDFIGTTDAQDLDIRTNDTIRLRVTQKGQLEVLNTGESVFIGEGAGANDDLTDNQNVFIGSNAGKNNTAGDGNTATGYYSLSFNTEGRNNTATGVYSLTKNTTGDLNTANGYFSLFSNTTGSNNTANGYGSLVVNETGNNNVANGHYALQNNLSGTDNTANGAYSLRENKVGNYNVANGANSLKENKGSLNTANGAYSLENNISGEYNVANGAYALRFNNTAEYNVANGAYSLYLNQSGTGNVANGYQSLYKNISGDYNVANGLKSLYDNETGNYNVANGTSSLERNTTGHYNVANGVSSLERNISGGYNVANGAYSLYLNQSGSSNVANGYKSLYSNVSGSSNLASGFKSLYRNTSGFSNVANGDYALYSNKTGGENVAIGHQSLYSNTTGSYNTAIGTQASFLGNENNSTAVGAFSVITASNQVRIGNNTVGSIGGFANWTNVSDARFKTNVKENVAGLDFIMSLRPVTYHLDLDKIDNFLGIPDSISKADESIIKARQEKENMLQTGFIAQEVEAAAKKAGYNFSGVDAPKNDKDHYGLRYAEFVVPLVKAVQEQQQTIASQEELIIKLMERLDRVEKQVKN